jgi:hypothetical protein
MIGIEERDQWRHGRRAVGRGFLGGGARACQQGEQQWHRGGFHGGCVGLVGLLGGGRFIGNRDDETRQL